jgi:hypothetical protein
LVSLIETKKALPLSASVEGYKGGELLHKNYP